MRDSPLPTPRADVLLEGLDAPLARLLRGSLQLATGDRRLARLLLDRQTDDDLDADWTAMRERLLSPIDSTGPARATTGDDPILAVAAECYERAQADRAAVRSCTTEAWEQLIETAPCSVPAAALHVLAGLGAAVDGRVETAQDHLALANGLDPALANEMVEQLVARAWIDARVGDVDATPLALTAVERSMRTNDNLLRAEAAAALVCAGGITHFSVLEDASSPDALMRWREVLGFTSPG
jgi:hypothetical protein